MDRAEAGAPLTGVRVLVTRPQAQAGAFVDALRGLGAEVHALPAIVIKPVSDWSPLDACLARLSEYSWLVFTSANAVTLFSDRLEALGIGVEKLRHLQIAAIGPVTAATVAEAGLNAGVVPESYRAEGLVEALLPKGLAGKRVLLPRARVAREVLPESLRQAGALVDLIPIYDTEPLPSGREQLGKIFDGPGIDVVTFTSSSTVEAFHHLAPASIPAGTVFAAIGPITAETARERGYQPRIVAERYTVEGLVSALVAYYDSARL